MNKPNLRTQKEIKELRQRLRDKIKKEWDRVLPFAEELSDRWAKAKYLKFGQGTSIYDSAFVFGDVRVGKNTWIGPFTILDGTGVLRIGSYCSISSGVQIYTHDTVKWALSGGKTKYEYGSVKIGDCCYIGPNVIIAKGVAIGKHCVIGANSFVNKNIPAYSIAFGSPCQIVGKVAIDKKGRVKFKYQAR